MDRGKIIHTKNDEMYIVRRSIKEDQLKDPDMKILKQYFRCDTVLRNSGSYFFCNQIKTTEYEEL
tara:strand:+ start:2431 stop:2625 length:195 start_codon:yes stop_codon:yes gene_type:complete